MKSITVIICSYFYGHLVAHCIDSVLGQTRKADRILVVDDASNDGTYEIAFKYKVECIKRTENMGTVKNFDDILMNHVDTDKCMFLGADNWLRPDALEKMDLDADIVSSDMAIVGECARNSSIGRRSVLENGYLVRKFNQKKGIKVRNYIHGSALYNVKMAKLYGYKPLESNQTVKRTREDWRLWRKMLLESNATHIHIPEPLLYYRRHSGNFNGIY